MKHSYERLLWLSEPSEGLLFRGRVGSVGRAKGDCVPLRCFKGSSQRRRRLTLVIDQADWMRSQEEKVYVQHQIREDAAMLWDLLERGAVVYIAGYGSSPPLHHALLTRCVQIGWQHAEGSSTRSAIRLHGSRRNG